MSKLKAVGMQERISYIHRVTGVDLKTIRKVLDTSYLLDMNSIAGGRSVLQGSYYTLYPEYRRERNSYSPYYKKDIQIPSHYLLKVRPHKKMREALEFAKENHNK